MINLSVWEPFVTEARTYDSEKQEKRFLKIIKKQGRMMKPAFGYLNLGGRGSRGGRGGLWVVEAHL